MNSVIKAKWLNALRSGKYKQGTRALRSKDKYCCLGVLSDLYAKENGKRWKHNRLNDVWLMEEENGILPRPVLEWAGLTDRTRKLLVTI